MENSKDENKENIEPLPEKTDFEQVERILKNHLPTDREVNKKDFDVIKLLPVPLKTKIQFVKDYL